MKKTVWALLLLTGIAQADELDKKVERYVALYEGVHFCNPDMSLTERQRSYNALVSDVFGVESTSILEGRNQDVLNRIKQVDRPPYKYVNYNCKEINNYLKGIYDKYIY